MTNQDLTPGTIAVTLDGKLAIVIGYKPSNTKHPVLYKFKVGNTTYKGSANDFRVILGKVDLGEFENASAAGPQPAPSTGFHNDAMVPDVLKGLKVGDTITIRTRKGVEAVTYDGYNSRRPKYPVSFTNSQGQRRKGSLTIVVRNEEPAKPQEKQVRTERQMMDEIRNAYCALSPENLTCDGELSRSQVKAKERNLRMDLSRLFNEIGRVVNEEEAYSFV